MPSTGFGPIKQVAYIVEDLEASMEHWATMAKIGPWMHYKNTTMVGRVRGVDTTVRMDVGLSYQGDVQIELIRPTSRTPSPYQHSDGRPLIGMHHIAWITRDLDGDVAKAKASGMTAAFEATNSVVRVAYMESSSEPGILFELIEAVPAVVEGFEQGMAASKAWDGIHKVDVIDFEG